MSDATDKRLSFKPYWQVLESVQTQFDLIRFSLKLIKPKDRKQFFKQKAEKKFANIEKFRTTAKQWKMFSDEEVDQIAADQSYFK
jgi:hypothetical protein